MLEQGESPFSRAEDTVRKAYTPTYTQGTSVQRQDSAALET
jgi:hypothetical protein